MEPVRVEAQRGDLYVHLAGDGGIFVAPGDELRRSAWVTLAGLRDRLDHVPPQSRVWLSEERGSPLARHAAAVVRQSGCQVTEALPLPETRRAEGITALMSAAYVGALDLVDDLLARGVPVDARDDKGYTALMFAAEQGQPAIVTRLLTAGADLEAVDADGTTPLMFAAWTGHPATVRCLVEAGADPTRTRPLPGGRPGETIDARGLALGRGHVEAAAALVGQGSHGRWEPDAVPVTFTRQARWRVATGVTIAFALLVGGSIAGAGTRHWYDALIGALLTAVVAGAVFGATRLMGRSQIRFDGWMVTVRPPLGRTWSFDAGRVAVIRGRNTWGGFGYRIRLRDDEGRRGRWRWIPVEGFRTNRVADELLARVSRAPHVEADKQTAAQLAAWHPAVAARDDEAGRP